jgi:hypothetical protein
LCAILALRIPGMGISRLASKQRSVGTPAKPVTPPQLVRRIELLVCCQIEPQLH